MESHKSGSNRLHTHGMRTSGDTASAALDTKANGQKHPSSGTPAKRISELSNSTKRVASPSAHVSERPLHKSNGRRGSSIAQHDPRLDRGQPSISDQDLTEADPDPTPYCYCQKQSYGEMIGCDSDDCRYEWVSLPLCRTLAPIADNRRASTVPPVLSGSLQAARRDLALPRMRGERAEREAIAKQARRGIRQGDQEEDVGRPCWTRLCMDRTSIMERFG